MKKAGKNSAAAIVLFLSAFFIQFALAIGDVIRLVQYSADIWWWTRFTLGIAILFLGFFFMILGAVFTYYGRIPIFYPFGCIICAAYFLFMVITTFTLLGTSNINGYTAIQITVQSLLIPPFIILAVDGFKRSRNKIVGIVGSAVLLLISLLALLLDLILDFDALSQITFNSVASFVNTLMYDVVFVLIAIGSFVFVMKRK